MSLAALATVPPLTPPAAPLLAAADFSIQQSPFAVTEALTLEQATGAAKQPVMHPPSPASRQGPPTNRPRSAEPSPCTAAQQQQQQQFARKHRPPRPPTFGNRSSLMLEVELVAREGSGSGSPPHSVRSPRGGGAPPVGRRPTKRLSKTLGRVCIECGTSSTTQWRSQGLLCNSCGVKLIKGRLPMDAESMHRRYLRLPPAIRDHPMWAAAKVVAQAQGAAAAAAGAGQPWCCPSCGHEGGEHVARRCGLPRCPRCVGRYHAAAPPGGAVAVAAAVAAPAPCFRPPALSPSMAQKRRKQAMPRSAATDSLSPASISSSGSSSIQAYGWQSAHKESQDDATSKELTPPSRPSSRRLQLRQKKQEQERGQQHHHHHHHGGRAAASDGAAPPATPAAATTLPGAGVLECGQAHLAADTPTAVEAAAALLVLTESDEAHLAAALQLDRPGSVAAAVAAVFAASQPEGDASEDPTVQAGISTGPPGAAPAALGGVPHLQGGSGGGGGGGLPAVAAPPTPLAAAAAVDSMQLYMRLIVAAGTPEAVGAGLTQGLVGCYLAAHTMPTQALAAAGCAATPEVAAAIHTQQEQQVCLVATMVAKRQYTAAVALMRSVVQLAGLAD